MGNVKTKVFVFEVRETTSREAEVTAPSLAAARKMMSDWTAGRGGDLADMGGSAPIQLSDLESIKLTSKLIDSLTRYA